MKQRTDVQRQASGANPTADTASMTLMRARQCVLLTGLLVTLLSGAVGCGEGDDSSSSQGTTLAERVEFATLDRAMSVLGHDDGWAEQLSAFDLGARQKTVQATDRREFLEFAAGEGRSWTAEEEAAWTPLIQKLSDAMEGLNLDLPNIDLVRTSGEEEFGSPYTRETAIMFPPAFAAGPATDSRGAFFLLAHETFHVLSRADSRLRQDLYALLGFESLAGFEYPTELEDRRVSNPDAYEYTYTLHVETESGSADVVPVIQSTLPLAEIIQLPDFFSALDIALVAVDPSTGAALRDTNGDLIQYDFFNSNWVEQMLRNSDYIIHPEEVLADNFATLMEWRATGVLPADNPGGVPIDDMDLLLAIQDVLTDPNR